MPNSPISQLPNLSGATDETLLAVVFSSGGTPTTFNITLQDLIQSIPFGTVYQTILPDVSNAYDLGSPSNTFKSIHVGEGTVFIGESGALGIDPQGILFSLSGFASNTLVLGGVINSGVTTTSGATFSLNEDYDVIVTNPTNTGVTYNITQQLVTTGGTIGQVFTQTGTTNFEWGWTTLSSGTSGTSGIDGTSGTSGVSGTSGTSGVSGTSGTSGIDGTSGTSGVSGTSGTSGIDGTSGTSGISGTSGTSGVDGTSGTSGIDGTSGTSGIDGTSGTSGVSGTSGTSGIDGTSGTSGVSGTSGSSGTSAPVSPYPIMYGLFSQTGSSVTISGTTSETTLINGGIGTLSVPASGFSVGDSFKVEMSGLLSTGSNQGLRIRVKTNSIVLLDSNPAPELLNGLVDDIWELRVYFTVRQIGGAGTATLSSNGIFSYSKQSNDTVQGFSFSTINDTTFDTTISNTLDITAEWSSDSSSNEISTEIFVLNKIY